MTDRRGIPLVTEPAPANTRDHTLLPVTLDRFTTLEPTLGPLPERPRLALDAGYDYRPADLAAVSRRPLVALVPVLEEALAGAVLDPAGERLRFRHQLIRQALVESTPTALRGALHRQMAEALDLTDAPLDQVAGHVTQATSVATDPWPHGWVARHARKLVTRSPATALEILTRAEAGADARAAAGRESDRTGLWLCMAEALNALGRPHEAEVIARRLQFPAVTMPYRSYT
ncbi:hypothetical protein UK12_14385 [Saccharothrix sp. ST-888]|nr:hypothetical protein UK12_14385 [Saccharothrix sp. ST-888]